MTLAVVLQDYVPAYRVPLFDALQRRLGSAGVELTVVHGAQPGGLRGERGDASKGDWSRVVPVHPVRLGRHELLRRSLPVHLSRAADIWLGTLRSGDADVWRAALGRKPLVVWGHGKSYVTEARTATDRGVRALARRAVRVLVYADGGRDALLSAGIDANKIVVVGNAADADVVLEASVAEACSRNPSDQRQFTALSIGGIDESKRTAFLVEAARRALRIEPRFELLVAGEGHDSHLLAGADGIRAVGRIDAQAKALLGGRASAIWNPGRVGLVALDAIALGLPLLTTSYRFHAPELEYLREGAQVFTLPDAPAEFAESAVRLMSTASTSVHRYLPFTAESVAAKMADALLAAL